MLGHLFGLLLAAAVAVPPGLQTGHQARQQQAGSQDAEDAGEAVQFKGASVRVSAGVGAQVAAAGARPPLLLHDVQVAFLLQLQDPRGRGGGVRPSHRCCCFTADINILTGQLMQDALRNSLFLVISG